MKHPFFIVASVFLILAMPPSTFAGSRKKKATPVKYEPPVISSVSANTITITERNTTRAFRLTQFSDITVNGQRATITDLKPGMTVNVTIGTDPTYASRINATGVPAEEKHKKRK